MNTNYMFQRALEPSFRSLLTCFQPSKLNNLAHQNRTIAIASDFRVDGAKSPEIPQKEGVLGSEIAARNRKSLATFHRTLKSQCRIAFSSLGNRAISGVRDGHRNRKSQKSLRFWCAKLNNLDHWSRKHVESALGLWANLQVATLYHTMPWWSCQRGHASRLSLWTKSFEIVFDIASAKLWDMAGERNPGGQVSKT